MNNKNVILLTGDLEVGKSTIADNVIKRLLAEKTINIDDVFGYKTVRLLNQTGEVDGFEVVTYGGDRCLMASTNIETPHRYMKFFVNSKVFDQTLTLEFEAAKKHVKPIIHIDEIGLMEKVSPEYTKMLTGLIRDLNVPVIAIIKDVAKDDFLDGIKKMDNIELYRVTKTNRKKIECEVFGKFSAIILDIASVRK